MTSLAAMRTILPLALTSGINFYLTVLVVGLSIRFGWVPNAPAGLEVLASLPALITAGVLYVLEFFADKIEFVDNLWDLIHTFIRPVGAIALTVASLSGIDPAIIEGTAEVIRVSPQAEITASLIAGAVALVSHSGKAGKGSREQGAGNCGLHFPLPASRFPLLTSSHPPLIVQFVQRIHVEGIAIETTEREYSAAYTKQL